MKTEMTEHDAYFLLSLSLWSWETACYMHDWALSETRVRAYNPKWRDELRRL